MYVEKFHELRITERLGLVQRIDIDLCRTLPLPFNPTSIFEYS